MGNKMWKPEEREQVLSKTQGKCAYCGIPLDLPGKWHVDHKIPVNQGGPNDFDNLLAACKKCNKMKAGRTPDQFKEALIKRIGRTLIVLSEQFNDTLVFSRSAQYVTAMQSIINELSEEVEFSKEHSPLIFWFESAEVLSK